MVIGADRVVCFPRTRAAADRLPARAASLRALAGLDPGLRTPEPLLLSEAHGGNETPFLVLTRIPGQPLENDALDDERVAETVAAQYVTLLAALYRAGADATARAVLPQNRADRWHQFAEGVKAELFGLMSHSGRLKAQRELAALDTLPHLTQAVVHGDLGAENVVWVWQNGMPHLSGILDWDDVASATRPRISQRSVPATAANSWSEYWPLAAGQTTHCWPASPRSATHSLCSRPSTRSATAMRRNSPTGWLTTAETASGRMEFIRADAQRNRDRIG